MRKVGRIAFVLMLLELIAATYCVASPQASTKCLVYEPNVVTISGTIARETFPGPPNYESISKGGHPETYWILKLAHPICVDANKIDDSVDRAQTNIRNIQLVFTDGADYQKYIDLVSKEVVATGTLFGSISAHHHTGVLLTVTELKKAQ